MMMNGVTVLLLKNKVEILEKLVNNYRYMNERKTAAPAQLFVCALFLYKKEEKKKSRLNENTSSSNPRLVRAKHLIAAFPHLFSKYKQEAQDEPSKNGRNSQQPQHFP
jgi:glucan phosphoethanolaminetransferase (alkaline phosphatase superfamily)